MADEIKITKDDFPGIVADETQIDYTLPQAVPRKRVAFIQLWENKLAFLGAILVFLTLISALFSPYLATHDPVKINIRNRLASPSRAHILGTDQLGRDTWSRIVYGARISMIVGFISVSIGGFFGVPLGSLAGYFGGRLDNLIMRFMDALLAFPGLLLAIAIVAVLGTNIFNLMTAIGITIIPVFSRLTRGSVLSEREKEYVEAAKVLGESDLRILFRYILPNTLSPLIVQATVSLAAAILVEAALSFLGLGTPPPTPSWGTMLTDGRDFIGQQPLIAVFPGLAISFAVLGFNLLGDGLRFHQKLSRKEAKERTLDMLDLVGIPSASDRFHDYPYLFSGGMRQRVMIAMALSCNPSLLIADEPTTALDVTIQAQILELLRGLIEKFQMSLIFITHNLGVVAQICDKIAVMYAGNIVELADKASLFKSPLHPYTVGLLNSIPKKGERQKFLQPIKGTVCNLLTPPPGCKFHPRCEKAFDRCQVEKPELREESPGHFVACHLYHPWLHDFRGERR